MLPLSEALRPYDLPQKYIGCLLYTSDAADEEDSVDLGGRRIIKKSINNIEKVKLIAADQLNVFDILNANKLVIGQSAITKIQEIYAS